MARKPDTRTILLVEDEITITMEEERKIRGFGYDVIVKHSCDEAVNAAVDGADIGLVLMDIGLGNGVDGPAAARRILEKRKVPVVFLVPPHDSGTADRARGIPCYGFLEKNSSAHILQSSIEGALALFDLHRQAEHTAQQRGKEFQAVFSLSEITEREGITIEDLCQEFAAILPQGWQYPETACARIVHGDREYRTGNYAECRWRLTAPIRVNGAVSGTVEIGYLTEKPPEDEGPFLKEERMLVDAVAERLGRIVERIEVEEKLRETEKKFNLITRNMTDGIIMLDMDLGVKYISSAVVAGSGYTQEEFKSLTFERQFSEESYRRLMKAVSDNLTPANLADPELSISVQLDLEFIRKDGSTFWNNITYRLIRDEKGRPEAILGVGRDITERVNVEEKLRESEEKFRSMVETTSDWVWSVDTRGVHTYSNGAVAELGYSTDEVIGTAAFPLMHPDDARLWRKLLAEHAAAGTGWRKETIRWLHRTGAVYYYESSGSPILDAGGAVIGFRGIDRNITERIIADEQIRSLLEEKEILLKEVHHRIKNNISAMMAILTLQADTLRDPIAVKALKDTRGRMQSMSLLYDSLYRADTIRSMPIAYYLPELLNEIVQLYHYGSAVRIDTRIENFTVGTKNLSSLGIIVNELVTNAMKYAFTGRTDGVITVSASKRDGRAAFVVEDNGIGLPEPFDIDTSTSFGLKLVRMLVRQINGAITIDRNRGTRFTITFPLTT